MKELLDLVMNSENQGNINDIAQKFGLDASQAQEAIGALLPGMTEQLQQRVQNPLEGAELLKGLEQNEFSQYVDDDNLKLTDDDSQQQGQNLLGKIFGGEQEQHVQQLSQQAAEKTGLDSSMLSQLAPMIAPMLMGSLGKQAQGGGIMSLLSSFGGSALSGLDSDGDGKPDAAGVLNKVTGLFK